jgi:dihydroorotase
MLTDESIRGYDTNFKMNPPLRSQGDVDAVRAGLADGTIDAIATDHAPHHIDEKNVEFAIAMNGVVGLETLLPLTLSLVAKRFSICLRPLHCLPVNQLKFSVLIAALLRLELLPISL